jgi:hypothetical protein
MVAHHLPARVGVDHAPLLDAGIKVAHVPARARCFLRALPLALAWAHTGQVLLVAVAQTSQRPLRGLIALLGLRPDPRPPALPAQRAPALLGV